MFLREALLRCAVLQRETAARFEALHDESTAGDATGTAWIGAALRERRRAELLDALASLCSALDDEGPFLVQVPLQLEAVRRALDGADWRRDRCASHPGCGCGELLQEVPGARVYADLIELAEPEVRRVLRLITNEIRGVRRAADAGVSNHGAKVLSACPA